MNMENRSKLFCIIFIALTHPIYRSHQQTFDPCENVEPDEKVRGPLNCSHYIVCDEEEPYEEFCENGMLFNDEYQECDDPEYVNCGDNYENVEEEEEYEEEDYGEEEEEEDVEVEVDRQDNTDVNRDVPNQCPRTDDPSQVVFIPSATNCSEYFLCYHGASITMHCANSLYFNPASHKCDFPRNVNCRTDTEQLPIRNPKCDRDVIMEVFPHPTQCDYYYYCRKGHLSIQQCPFYYYFDATTKTCRIRRGYEC